MNRNLPVPVRDETVPYLQKRKRRENRSAFSKYFLILLAVILLACMVLCAGKFGLFSFLGGAGDEDNDGKSSTETTTERRRPIWYKFDYEKLSDGALAILPCDLSAWTVGKHYDNQTHYDIEAGEPAAVRGGRRGYRNGSRHQYTSLMKAIPRQRRMNT